MSQTNVYTDTIAAYFEDSGDARKAVDALRQAGFQSAHLGIAHRGSYTGRSTTKGNSSVYETEEKGEGGSTWDKIKAWFSGTEAEPYADEPTGRDSAQQEIIPPTNRFDEENDDTSDLHGSFAAMNIPEDRSRYFSHRFSHSSRGAVVTVQADARKSEVEEILLRYNADFGENAETYDYAEQGAHAGETSERQERMAESSRDFQLLGEVLRVHKDRVNRGDVRIRKEVVTENQTVQVPIQREELVVERKPASGVPPASGTVKEDEIRVPLSEERASLDRSTVVREEVSVSKKPVEQVRNLEGEVSHEELVVDDETKRERSA